MVHNLESFRDFLKASVEESFSFDKEEFNKIYDESLHTDSYEAQDILHDIENKINNRDTQTFIIKGYKGCGKSTFCHYLKKHLPFRVTILNFDENIDQKLLVRKELIEYIFNNILEDIASGDSKITKELLSKFYWDEKKSDFVDVIDDPHNFFKNVFFLLKENMKKNYDHFNEKLKKKLVKNFGIKDLFTLIFLWDIVSHSISDDSQKCVFILDNLDVLVHYAPVGELFTEYFTFLNNCKNMISKIYGDYKLLQNYSFIFVMRETTQATIIEHLHDKNPREQGYEEYDFSTVIPKEDILEKRLNYIENSEESDYAKKIAAELNKFRNDKFIQEHFFYLFNEDYRTSIEVICKLIWDKKSGDTFKDIFIQDYFDIKNSYPYNTTVGSHGLLIRLLCNLFLEEKYLANVLSTEVSESEGSNTKPKTSINISRLLLTYLKNQNKTISIQEIFNAFNGICKQDVIFKTIWILFEIRNMQYWNHLITFEKLSGFDNFKGQSNNENLLKKIHKDSTIQITPAGKFFLDAILVHFEYFSCRANISSQNQSSLFCKKNVERIDNNPDLDFVLLR